MTALGALTERSLLAAARDGGLMFEIFARRIFGRLFAGAARPGRHRTRELLQYLVPAVAIQAVVLVAMLTADRAARDHLHGLGERLRTLPVGAAVPVTAR